MFLGFLSLVRIRAVSPAQNVLLPILTKEIPDIHRRTHTRTHTGTSLGLSFSNFRKQKPMRKF